jgi:D-glycero-alpha-D-manno-heptose-7-phosphate kinase
MPKETGLGSSSALAVALIQALDFKLNIAGSRRGLAEKAFKLERGTGAPVGKQDHYAAAFGGFRVYHFGDWAGHPAQTIPDGARILRELQGWALLLYTGRTRSAAAILSEQSRRGDMGALTEIMYIAAEAQSLLMQHTDAATPIAIGSLLHHAWLAKRRVVEGITDDTLDAQYTAARDAGAIGGKLLGAGGGGCWFFVVPPDARPHVQNALGLPVIPWSPDWDGCKAVLGHGAFVRKGPR